MSEIQNLRVDHRVLGIPTLDFEDCCGFRISDFGFAREEAFTIIELLVVIGLIIILAGLVLSTVGYVQNKGARSQAETEIAALSAALENYKSDNGIYPTDATKTDALDPGATINLTNYAKASLYLYEQLTGDTDANRRISASETGKNYFAFKSNQLSPSDQAQPVIAIRDPFGNSYGYSTAKAANPSGIVGYNPTFDLWSTAGATSGTPNQAQWIKNW